LRKFLMALIIQRNTIYTNACPLSSLPRDGGDVRGGLLTSLCLRPAAMGKNAGGKHRFSDH
jgi:hypothetical protein